MKNSRLLAFGGILAGLAAALQIIPAVFTDLLAPVTMLSALPIYIICRLNPRTGLIAFFSSAVIIFCISVHEGMFYAFTNGLLGLVMGISSYKIKSRIAVVLLSSTALAISLFTVNTVIGIPVFGIEIPGFWYIQASVLLAFSLVYASLYLCFAIFVFNFLKKAFHWLLS